MVLARNRGQFREAGSSDVERLAVATAATNSACREITGGSGGTPSATASVGCLVGSAQWAVQSGDIGGSPLPMSSWQPPEACIVTGAGIEHRCAAIVTCWHNSKIANTGISQRGRRRRNDFRPKRDTRVFQSFLPEGYAHSSDPRVDIDQDPTGRRAGLGIGRRPVSTQFSHSSAGTAHRA